MSLIKRDYGEIFSLSLHSQKGAAKRGVVGPQNVLYRKHSSHTLAESAWQRYEKEIKDVFMQHSQRELTSHLKVLYWRVLSVRLRLERSTKTPFCEWQAGCEVGWQHLGWRRWRGLAWSSNKHRATLINSDFLTKFCKCGTSNHKTALQIRNSSGRSSQRHVLTFAYACIAAGEAIPLLSVSVQPDAEDHEDDPAGSSYACYKGRLLDHIWDLLGQGVLLAHRLCHSPRCIWGWEGLEDMREQDCKGGTFSKLGNEGS